MPFLDSIIIIFFRQLCDLQREFETQRSQTQEKTRELVKTKADLQRVNNQNETLKNDKKQLSNQLQSEKTKCTK